MLASCVQEPEGVIYSCDPPHIIETVPENGGEEFGLDDTIIFVFEHPVDTTTVNDTTVFVIETSTGDTLIGDVFPDCDETLPRRAAQFSTTNRYAALLKTSPLHDTPHECGTLFFFDPVDSLKPGEEYTVIITTGIEDTLGTELPEINTWTFTTTDTLPDPPPGVDVYPEPGDTNVPLDEVVEITFDTLWNPTLFDDSTILVILGDDTIPGNIVYDPMDTSLTFDPTDSLLPDTTYEVVVSVPDACVSALCPADSTFTWTFTTGDTIPDPPLPEPPGVPTTRHAHTTSFSLAYLETQNGFTRYAWNPLPEAVTYRFQLSTNPNFTTTVIDNAGIPQSTPLIYQHITTADVSVGTYYWRVNATNTGGTGAWTPVRTINVLP
jgi:hypothetical protein